MTHHARVVSAGWLEQHQCRPPPCIVDATVHLPHAGRDAGVGCLEEHFTDAEFFESDHIADPAKLPARTRPRIAVTSVFQEAMT